MKPGNKWLNMTLIYYYVIGNKWVHYSWIIPQNYSKYLQEIEFDFLKT